MYQNYLITGATGFLGRAVVQLLVGHRCRVLALVMENDPLIDTLPSEVEPYYGNLTEKDSMRDFFAAGGENFCVLHCAGIVSIASNPGKMLYSVNVQGTQNIIDLCREYHAAKLVYVSSVHAIPEKPAPQTITETHQFTPDEIDGDYGKSKAMATALVLKAAQEGLNASVVHPSGIIGPGDLACGNMTRMLLALSRGRLPLGVKGGYDFVDVRDVAVGILACAERGKAGECYILSGHYASIRDIFTMTASLLGEKAPRLYAPAALAKCFAPICEKIAHLRKQRPFFTPYSISVLDSNGHFSNAKASKTLGFHARPLKETLRSTLHWFRTQKLLSPAR